MNIITDPQTKGSAFGNFAKQVTMPFRPTMRNTIQKGIRLNPQQALELVNDPSQMVKFLSENGHNTAVADPRDFISERMLDMDAVAFFMDEDETPELKFAVVTIDPKTNKVQTQIVESFSVVDILAEQLADIVDGESQFFFGRVAGNDIVTLNVVGAPRLKQFEQPKDVRHSLEQANLSGNTPRVLQNMAQNIVGDTGLDFGRVTFAVNPHTKVIRPLGIQAVPEESDVDLIKKIIQSVQ